MTNELRVTSRRYRRPHRPPPVAAMERWLRRLGGEPPPLSPDALVRAALTRTGASSFDDDLEPLERLCDALEREAKLTWTGRALTRARLVGALTSRLRLRALLLAHPEVADVPVPAPLFVTGLQRTGTTLLQRLLAAAPGLRGLRSWEALDPIPTSALLGVEPRRLTAKAAEHTLRYLAPDFFAVHPVEADAPEEEVVLMDQTFISQVSEASYHVPSFARWVEGQDHRVAYRHLRRCLQALSWQCPEAPRRWVLKSPVHLEQLDALLDVFPDAKVLQTHRDPRATLPSFCSMVAHGRGVFSDEVDPTEVGEHWLGKVRRMVERAMDSRARQPASRFLDVHYRDLVAAPIGTAAAACAFAGRPLEASDRQQLQAWLVDNPRHKYGRHVYRAEDFGLSAERIDEAFGAYVGHHRIRPDEAPAARANVDGARG